MNLQPCGTRAAYRRHKNHGEPIDQACQHARDTYYNTLRKNPRRTHTRTRPEPRPTNTETIAEIEHLLMCGEGEHAILKATGYTAQTLERKLHRAGRADLIPRILHGEQRMVWAA